MAFPTGHNQPSGFVAGQLRDGASFGTIGPVTSSQQSVNFPIILRYYKGVLIAVVSKVKASDGAVLEQPSIKPKQYLLNINELTVGANLTTLKDLASIVADEAKLVSIGLASNQVIPVNPTGELIPFQLTADGKVEAFVSAADKQKAIDDANKAQTDLINKVANNLSGTTTGTSTGTGTGTGVLSSMTMTTKIIIGVVVAVVVGGIIYLATKKKKGGKGK